MNKDPQDINDIGYCMSVYDEKECGDCLVINDCPGAINVFDREFAKLAKLVTKVLRNSGLIAKICSG